MNALPRFEVRHKSGGICYFFSQEEAIKFWHSLTDASDWVFVAPHLSNEPTFIQKFCDYAQHNRVLVQMESPHGVRPNMLFSTMSEAICFVMTKPMHSVKSLHITRLNLASILQAKTTPNP